MHSTKTMTGIGTLGCCQDTDVARCARLCVAINLQKVALMLRRVWAFSVAADMSTHMGTSYLDVRVSLCWYMAVLNIHLLAIPMHYRHTGEIMFDTMAKCLDLLHESWKDTIIGVSTDGTPSITGRIQGFATHVERAALSPGRIRVWCDLHQLDLVMQAFYKAVMSEQWYKFLIGLVGYLCRQQNLITEIMTQYPLVSDTH